eukprot:TRINITY_DN16486_c0_g1_i5.p1 TRINITY_DN16486_c0_g1~~TRINITY_DN16486_c0_g1_i5.p1  ORF type:complete len:105 (-),score=12.86 TRINITY_DN16486_c0_g1_i5:96-410(-)
MIRRPPRSTLSSSSAASDVYKRQISTRAEFSFRASSSDRGERRQVARRTLIRMVLADYLQSHGVLVVASDFIPRNLREPIGSRLWACYEYGPSSNCKQVLSLNI